MKIQKYNKNGEVTETFYTEHPYFKRMMLHRAKRRKDTRSQHYWQNLVNEETTEALRRLLDEV